MRVFNDIRLLAFLSMMAIFTLMLPQTSRAQAFSQSCGFNSIGDWVCPQGNAAGGGGAGPLSGGGNPFSSGGPLNIPSLPGGSVTQAALEAMFAGLSPQLQACATQSIASTNLSSLSLADILNLISNIMTLQSGFQNIPSTVTCPDGTTVPNGGVAYMQQAYINQACSSTGSSLASGGNPFTTFLNTLTGNMSSSLCSGTTGPTPPTPNSTGGSTTNPPPAGGSNYSASGSCAAVNSGTLNADLAVHMEEYEGRRSCTYNDSRGFPTIGIGHLLVAGDGYNSSTCLTEPEIDALFASDIGTYRSAAESIVAEAGINNHEFLIALTSVAYQLGANLRGSYPTIVRMINNGEYTQLCTTIKGWPWHSQTPVRTEAFCKALHDLAACGGASGAPYIPANTGDSLTQDSGYVGEQPPTCMTSSSVNSWDQSKSDIALANELGTVGYCARGVRTILQNIPGSGVSGPMGNAHEFQTSLPAAGYTLLTGFTPETAPVGCILVYDRNSPPGSSGGAAYGHVEIVVTKQDGTRGYISDHFTTRPGGTVRDNFVGCYSNTGGAGGGSTTNPACSQQMGGGQSASYTPIGAQAGSGAGGFGGFSLGGFGSILGGVSNVFSGGSALLSGGLLNPSAWVNTTLNTLASSTIANFQNQIQSQISGLLSAPMNYATDVMQQMTNVQNLMSNLGQDQLMQFANNLGVTNMIEQITTFDPNVFLESQLSGIMQNAQGILNQGNTLLSGITTNLQSTIQGTIQGAIGNISTTLQSSINNAITNQLDLGLQSIVGNQLQLDIMPNLDSIISAGGLTSALQTNIVNAVQTQAQSLVTDVVNQTIADIQGNLPNALSATDISDLTTQIQNVVNADISNLVQTQVLNQVDSQLSSAISSFTPPAGDQFQVQTFMGQIVSAQVETTDFFGFTTWQDMGITIP